MKINELKRIAEENDYELTKSNVHYKLTHKYCGNNITINYLCKNRLWISIPFDCDERDFNMIKAAIEFAETPPEDRVEEKKFYLRHKFLKLSSGEITRENSVVNYNTRDNVLFLANKQPVGFIRTFFTLKEIEEIKEKFDTDLKDFELVEVEDE